MKALGFLTALLALAAVSEALKSYAKRSERGPRSGFSSVPSNFYKAESPRFFGIQPPPSFARSAKFQPQLANLQPGPPGDLFGRKEFSPRFQPRLPKGPPARKGLFQPHLALEPPGFKALFQPHLAIGPPEFKALFQPPILAFGPPGFRELFQPPGLAFALPGFGAQYQPPILTFGRPGLGGQFQPEFPFARPGLGGQFQPEFPFTRPGLGGQFQPEFPFTRPGLGGQFQPEFPFTRPGLGLQFQPPHFRQPKFQPPVFFGSPPTIAFQPPFGFQPRQPLL